MDGLEKRLRESLQSKLSVGLSLAILGVALIAAIFAFFLAHHEAEELQDDVLRQLAAVIVRNTWPWLLRLWENSVTRRFVIGRIAFSCNSSPAVPRSPAVCLPICPWRCQQIWSTVCRR
jgi:hypothetical protein